MKKRTLTACLSALLLTLSMTGCTAMDGKALSDSQGRDLKISKVVTCDDPVAEKPVIYLYDDRNLGTSYKYTEDNATTIRLELSNGMVKSSYPRLDPATSSWKVTAYEDGKLVDKDGKLYDYLFWDAQMRDVSKIDVDKGYSVKGEDTASFLEEKLSELGLNRREAEDFITYWLPRMEKNPYNTICFQTKSYTDWAKLTAEPAFDSTLRVFMAWYPTDEKETIKEQSLNTVKRGKRTLVEWGGIEVRVEFVTTGSSSTTTTSTSTTRHSSSGTETVNEASD